ncbi:MAG TPA: hypothetical protein VLM76_10050 [Patescibacteria group bacterium]|nr:hypothetical protein [Patescibacteria group bacterium]
MGATGLSGTPAEYRRRLIEQSDEQLDAWAAEAMRDISIRRGVLAVLHDVREASGMDDRGLEKVYAAGGGPPAVVGRDGTGRLMVPAATVHCLVRGIRAIVPGSREVLVDFLVANFEELVYA